MRNLFILLFLGNFSFAQLNPVAVSKDLDKNYVKAKIFPDADKFWNKGGNQGPAYEVPKGKGVHAGFANSIWIGGLDNNGQLHIAANTYKQSGLDFWPGPLDTTNIAVFTASNSTPYNKVWKVDCNDIDNFVTAFNSGSVAANTYTVPDGILSYPGKGKANFQRNVLPFADVNNNGVYSPQTDGDYPLIKGHQQILSVYNDRNGTHTETQGLQMGLEIYERAYAFFEPNIHDSMQAINYSTFYHYVIYNRSGQSYNNVYLSDWSEVDLGYWNDDYIGTDINNNFAYCYNANPFDPTMAGSNGYGNKPPVLSHAIMKTNCTSDGIDNNNNSLIDEPGEQFIMSRTSYYNNNLNQFLPATTNPTSAINFYNYMKGIWKDGSAFTFSGTAYGGSLPTNYVYTGDPSTNTGWTEASVGDPPGDRRLIITSGPFNFPANTKLEWGYALVFSQDTSQAINTIMQLNSRVKRDVKNVLYYEETHQVPLCTPQVNVGFSNHELKSLNAMIYPNPSNGLTTIDLNENVRSADIVVVDLFGKVIAKAFISGGYRAQLDLSAAENGVYFITVSSGERKVTAKLVKS